MVAPYVTITSIPVFSRNKTGFGYMVYDIANAVGKKGITHVLCTDSLGGAFEEDGVYYLKRSLSLYLRSFFKCISPRYVLKFCFHYKMRFGTLLRLFYYWMMTGFVRELFVHGSYDIIHFHGCGFETSMWIRVCRNVNQKFVVTLHGLNSFSDTVNIENAGKQYERDFLRQVANGDYPITVISTGIKRLIENAYGCIKHNNIIVVNNSFSFKKPVVKESIPSIRELYGIPENAKIVLYVGNIGRRKNQGQIIRAFNYLPKDVAEFTYVLFLGHLLDKNYNLNDYAKKTNYPDHFIFCGAVDKDKVPWYYMQGDAVALMSLSEGFGLSLIEGMHYGLPCLTFNDIDAYEDIYNSQAVIGVESHDDRAVADGLAQLMNNKWNKELIVDYSKKFESETMADKYISVYNQIIQNYGSIFIF